MVEEEAFWVSNFEKEYSKNKNEIDEDNKEMENIREVYFGNNKHFDSILKFQAMVKEIC